jgi:hypothetical protein
MEKGGCGAIERDFSFWMPLEVVKGQKGEMRIGGIASDEESHDLQGEKVFVDGLDTSYLLQRGAFNWDHLKGPEDILGEIDTVQKQEKKLYVEGFLYPKVKKAIDVFDLMQSLKESGSNRKLGLSLEGKVKERDEKDAKVIKKAWIKNVAITYNPINQGAWVDMIKSLGNFTFDSCDKDCSRCPLCEAKKEVKLEPVKKATATPPSFIVQDGIKYYPKDFGELKKAGEGGTSGSGGAAPAPPQSGGLAAGHDNPASSGGISGSALRRQSLDKKKKKTTYDEEHVGQKVEPEKSETDKKKKKKMTKSEVFEFIKSEGNSEDRANLLTDLVFAMIEVAPILAKSSEGAKKAWITRRKGLISLAQQKKKKKDPRDTPEFWEERYGKKKKGADVRTTGKGVTPSPILSVKEKEDWKRHSKMPKKVQKEAPKELAPTGTAKLVAHEIHRITSMSDKALLNRATKITDPNKMKNFYLAAKLKGKGDLAGAIITAGGRIGINPHEFGTNAKETTKEFRRQLSA